MQTPPKYNQRGMALVVVLVFLVLLSVFIVGFFSNSQDELTAAQSFTGEVSAQQLSTTAVSVVMGQIREATTRAGGRRANGKYGNGAWGSQPGMIRVYADGEKASGKADAFFKLYSSDDMVVSGGEIETFNPITEIPFGKTKGWNYQPALWTNLNEKVIVPPPPGSGDKSFDRFPIVDPFTETSKKNFKPEGLEFAGIDFDKINDDDSREPARMPVKWLYVLRDGTLTAPSAPEAEGTRAKWVAGPRAPTITNPIVGRIAFWTDDESCKVNINTAGGFSTVEDSAKNPGGIPVSPVKYTVDEYAGSFWDTPRAMTDFDRGILTPNGKIIKGGLAVAQPVRGEFQRYPGHPATTSLGVVFKNWLSSGQLALLTPRLQYSFDSGTEDAGLEQQKDSWPIIRRGSNYGTSRIISKPDPEDPMRVSTPPDMRVKRLYASVDELFFAQPDPSSNASTTRVLNDQELRLASGPADAVLTPTLLESLRFVLTAHSRAPELNLYGRPRMTIWPVFKVNSTEEENDLWNPSDQLLAFCSTLGPTPLKDSSVGEDSVKRFIFQRSPAKVVGTFIPSGATSSNKEFEIERNRKLFTILQETTNLPFPGFGGPSFMTKYAKAKGGDVNDRDQILTEMFDYIRTVNLRDSFRDKEINIKYRANPVEAFKQKIKYKYAPRGLVVPLAFNRVNDASLGFGRFPTISEAALVFYQSGFVGADNQRYLERDNRPPPAPAISTNVLVPGTWTNANPMPKIAIKSKLIRAFLLFETFNPMQGYAPIQSPTMTGANAKWNDTNPIVFELEYIDETKPPLMLNGNPNSLPFFRPKVKTNVCEFRYLSGIHHGRNSGGSEGFFHTLYEYRNPPPELDKASNPYFNYVPAYPPTASNPTTPTYLFQTYADHADVPGYEIPLAATTMVLGGADLRLTISFKGDEARRKLTLKFPGGEMPVPDDRIWPNIPGNANNSTGGGMTLTGNGQSGSDYTGIGKGKVDPKAVRSFNGRLNWVQNNDSNNYNLKSQGGGTPDTGTPGPRYVDRWRQILQPGDVVRSLQFGTKDVRVACISDDDSIFEPHPSYNDPAVWHAQTLRMGEPWGIYYGAETKFGNISELPAGRGYPPQQAADIPEKSSNGQPLNGVRRTDGKLGDFDTGIGNLADGPFCGKADEGNLAYKYEKFDQYGNSFTPKEWVYPTPYFTWAYQEAFDTFFTPNRQVPSPVAFGSLLAGKGANWQTLCFSPTPAGDNHPGRVNPKDYLWLDLFTMPVVEPYAISEPFSTAGKVNLNYPIIPFPHIKRTTALRAALQGERVTAFPLEDVIPGTANPQLMSFKTGKNTSGNDPLPRNYRALVDRDETLKAFDAFFNVYYGGPLDPSKDDGSPSNRDKGFFKSAAQICDFYLYPIVNGKKVAEWSRNETEIKQFWALSPLTGDNVREKPYSDLYPRLTTKSNTFTVHVRAQALRQSAATNAKEVENHYLTWDEKRDRVIGEYRGSSIIERYIDPDDSRFDPKTPRGSSSDSGIDIDDTRRTLEDAYRFRVLNTKRFSP